MLRERIIAVFVLTLVGLVLLGIWRPVSPDPQDDVRAARNAFFIEKTHGQASYDMVLVGDSRALRGISPEQIERQNPGLRVFNFAFHAGGFNDEIFDAAEALLDADSPRKAIVIAPTPLGFIDWKQTNAQYREYLNKPGDEVLLYRKCFALAGFLQPLSPTVFLRKALGMKPPRLLEEDFTPAGWISTRQTPADNFADLSVLRDQLLGNRSEPAVMANLMARVADWESRGIRVFGTFVPAYEPRVALEDSMLDFPRETFMADFDRAGGRFFTGYGTGYETYDGSHLYDDSAVRFSAVLGEKINQALAESGS